MKKPRGPSRLTDDQRRIAEENVRLVYQVAKKWMHLRPTEIYQDLLSRLFVRYCECIANYDPSRGTELSTYVVKSLNGEVCNFFRDEWFVRPPREFVGVPITEIASGTIGEALSEEEKIRLLTAFRPVSLDDPVVLDTSEVGRQIGSDEDIESDTVSKISSSQVLARFFSSLTEEERAILILHLAGQSNKTIAKEIGLDKRSVDRIIGALVDKCKHLYEIAESDEKMPEPQIIDCLISALAKKYQPRPRSSFDVRRRVLNRTKGDRE